MPAAKPRPGSMRNSDTLELGELLGSTWDGYVLVGGGHEQGEFVHPYWRRGFNAGDLNAMFYQSQQVYAFEQERRLLEADLDRAVEAQFAAEKQAYWFKRQLVLESRMGAMLLQLIDP